MKTFLLIGALVGATVLAYRNTVPGQFIYDDNSAIVHNPLIRELKNIPLILGTSYWGTNIGEPNFVKGGLYRPFTVISFALNYRVGKLNPEGYHIVNLVLHIGVSILLALLGIRLGISWKAAWAAAFLFALLPVHTEAVSNIVGRSEILAALFVLISWICVSESPSKVQLILGAFSFALALLSKENAMAFLPILLISDFARRDASWQAVLQKRLVVWVTFGGVGLLYLEWKYLVLGSIAEAGGIPYFLNQNFPTVFLTTSKFAVLHYLKPLILGTGFCIDFTRPSFSDAHSSDPWAWAAGLGFMAIVGFSLVSALRHKNQTGFWIAASFVFLLPFLNVLAPLEVVGAERFLYLPSIGYCLLVGIGMDKLQRIGKLGSSLIFFGLCLWYGKATYERNKMWQSEQTFWSAAAQEAPLSARAWNGMGLIKMHQKQYAEAIPLFIRAVRLNPLLVDAELNIALAHFLQKNYEQAKGEYKDVIRQSPFDPDALFHLGYIYDQEHDYKSASQYYAAALAVNPLDRASQRNLAILHCRAKDTTLCSEELIRFLQSAPPEETNDDLRLFLRKLTQRKAVEDPL